MKKRTLFSIIAILLVAFTLLGVLASCNGSIRYGKGDNSIVIMIGETTYKVKTNALYIDDVLEELSSAEKLVYESKDSAYGSYIVKLGDLDLSQPNTFVAIYHDIEDETLIWAGYDIVVDGKTFYSSGVGASQLKVIDGATYLFKVSSY